MEKSNNWIDAAFKSVQHQKQPMLHADVFSKIEKRIHKVEEKVILMPIWKLAVAAAIIISVNLLAFNTNDTSEQNFNTTEYQLMSNYNLYTNE
jgi:hypothetical protein